MGYEYYITPEEYAVAEEVGITRVLLNRRIREQAWPKEKAITTPPRKLTDRSYWRAVAQKNGITYAAFNSRLRRGWEAERAATKPLQTPEEMRACANKAADHGRVLPREYILRAEENGIPYTVFYARVRCHGWNMDRAAIEPIWTCEQKGRLGGKRRREREGDWAAQIFGKKVE